LQNLLFMNLFDKAVSKLPQQQSGVFLQENQSWERILIYSWFRFNHKSIYGYPHSTTRDWDLRYFFDPRCYSSSKDCCLPLPTKIAVHGKVVRNALIDSGYPTDMLLEVEALRFLHLNTKNARKEFSRRENSNLQLLVFGGYVIENTHRQMQMLNDAVVLMNTRIDIVVKPHPLCNIQINLYPNLSVELTNKPIEELLENCDVAYTDCVTSAAVDAYCLGVPVVSERNPSCLNISPLRGKKGVFFASKPSELATIFQTIEESYETFKNVNRDLFHTDSLLPRWKNLLAVKYDL